MGLKCASDFAQQVMEEVLHEVDNTGVYLDDIGALSMTWKNNLLLEKFSINWKPMVSHSTRSNANGPFKKLIDLDTGSYSLV